MTRSQSKQAPQVFISCSNVDIDLAVRIAAALRAGELRTWLYRENSKPGIEYTEQVSRAINDSDALLVLLSADAARSRQVQDEVLQAKEDGLSRIPVLLNMDHAELKTSFPAWRHLTGACVSIEIPENGLEAILGRIVVIVREAIQAASTNEGRCGAVAVAPITAPRARTLPDGRVRRKRRAFSMSNVVAFGLIVVSVGFLYYLQFGSSRSESNLVRTESNNSIPSDAGSGSESDVVTAHDESPKVPASSPAPTTLPDAIVPATQANRDSLAEAVRSDDVDRVRALVSLASDWRSDENETLLHLSARYDAHRVAPMLIEAGVPMDIANSLHQHTALHVASQECHDRIVDVLTRTGARTDRITASSESPLHLAAYNDSCADAIGLLVRVGKIDPSVRSRLTGDAPLHAAASSHAMSAVKKLLELQADVNTQNLRGETPLIVAIQNTSSRQEDRTCAMVECLLAAGADQSLTTNDGKTALAIAIIRGWTKVARCLERSSAIKSEQPPQEGDVQENASGSP